MTKLCWWRFNYWRAKPTTPSATYPKPGLPSPQPGLPPTPFTVPQNFRRLSICSQVSRTKSLHWSTSAFWNISHIGMWPCTFPIQVLSMQLKRKIVKRPILTSLRLLRATTPSTARRLSRHLNTCSCARSCSTRTWDNCLLFILVCVWEPMG